VCVRVCVCGSGYKKSVAISANYIVPFPRILVDAEYAVLVWLQEASWDNVCVAVATVINVVTLKALSEI